MSISDPTYDVAYVLRSSLPHLPTVDDPSKDLATQVLSPFGTGPVVNPIVAITVLSMLDEPVEAVARHAVHGSFGQVPVVRTNLNDAGDRSPTHVAAGDGVDGLGWIDPTGFDDMVSEGTWLIAPGWGPIRKSGGVLHLRCTNSGVDILVGALVAERLGDAGGWNPYNIALFEPGTLHPNDEVYDDFYDNHVNGGDATSDDREGHSTTAPVHYLARTPQGRTDWYWHVLVFLGPKPVKEMWDVQPFGDFERLIADMAHASEDSKDGIERILAITTTPTNTTKEQDAAIAAVMADYTPGASILIWLGYMAAIQEGAAPAAATP